MILNPLTSFFVGVICGLCFAPVFFLPGVICTSILLAQIKISKTKFEAIKYGYMFGFGFYLSTLYWISFGVSVYIDEFWWAIPFALFGLPAFLAIFSAIIAWNSWYFRRNNSFHLIFCCVWVFIEWVVSWIFSGLPWGLIGYALSNFLVLIQFADITGIFGLSFVVIYVGSSFYDVVISAISVIPAKAGTSQTKEDSHLRWNDFLGGGNDFLSRLFTSVIIIIAITTYGYVKIENNPTEYTEISARLVQPSIPQTEKWSADDFWRNLELHTSLSGLEGNPDLIIWSEAALVAPHHIKPIWDALSPIFSNDRQILITGGVSDNNKTNDELEIYSSMIGINQNAVKIFEYHKSHLVPFGEYMPLKNILPLKKITHGLMDYSAGIRKNIKIAQLNLDIQPLICYESIFSNEAKTSNRNVDVIINITNDAWYGNSSGPYQHFEISRMRAVENGLPMLRTANNGLSAFIDPIGRVLNITSLNEVIAIDGFIPKKLSYETTFSKYGMYTTLITMILVSILQLASKYFLVLRRKRS